MLVIGLFLPSLVPNIAKADNSTSTPVVQNGFESGAGNWTTQGDGNTKATVSSTTAHTGSQSLLTTGRSDTWMGPSLDLTNTLQKGATYQITGWVKLVSGETPSKLNFTVKRTPADGSAAQYDQVTTPTTVSDSGWVKLDGTYTFSTDVSALSIYLESDSKTNSYYLDDFSIIMTKPAPTTANSGSSSGSTQSVNKTYGFENGSTNGWVPRGDSNVKIASVTDQHESGSSSLLTTGRSKTWMGPSLDVKSLLQQGVTYTITAWVKEKTAPGTKTPSTVTLSMEKTPTGGTQAWDNIASAKISDTSWTKISGTYSIDSPMDELLLYVESSNATENYYIDNVSIQSAQPVKTLPLQTDIPSLKNVYKNDFLVGSEAQAFEVADPEHAQLLKQQFDTIVPGNEMKPASLENVKGTFTYGPADQIAKFAMDNKMALRFHTLVWYQQTPDWFFQDSNGKFLPKNAQSKQLVLQRLQDYINTVLTHFKNEGVKFESVDVVNEAIDPSQPSGFRNSYWYQYTGTDYIKTAFETAQQVLPNSELVINDYNLDQPKKSDILYNFLKKWQTEWKTTHPGQPFPVDGVGHQTHIRINTPSISDMAASLDKFASLGLDNKITEMDVTVYQNDTDKYTTIPQDLLVQQGYRYKDLFNLFKEKKNEISTVMLWGMADDNTWLKQFPITRNDAPLLFDDQLQPKPAFWGAADPSKLPILIQKIKAPKGTPIIDGKTDQVWEAMSSNTIKGDNNLSGSFKTLWDNKNLYVLANIKDPTKGKNGKIDVFYQNGKKVTFKTDGSSNQNYKVVPTKDGYTMELAVPLSSVKQGDQVPFDLRISNGTSTVSWNDPTNKQENETNNWGQLTLDKANKITDAIQGAPVIDGNIDPIWANAKTISTDTWVQGTSGSTAKVKTMWKGDYLYVLANVTDSHLSKKSTNAYEQDSVEFFVDQNNHKSTAYEPDDGQYRVNFANQQSYNGNASKDNFKTATKITKTGYIVEAAIKLDKVTPKASNLIGFDVQVNNDQNGDGKRDSVAIWSDPTGQSYQNTSQWGTLILDPVSNNTGNGSSSGSGSNGNNSGTTTPQTVSVTPGSSQAVAVNAGDTLQISGSTAKVTLPSDLPQGTTVKVTKLSKNDTSVKNATDLTLAGDVYHFAFTYPKGQENYTGHFALVLPYDKSKYSADNVAIYYYNEQTGKWEKQNGTVDASAGTITATVPHFSTYGVFAKASASTSSQSSNSSSGNQLPDTATPYPNYIMLGLLLLALGGSLLVVYRRRRA